jgi:hypothetical protein
MHRLLLPHSRHLVTALLLSWITAGLASAQVSSQPAPNLKGVVVDAFSMAPIPGASVVGGGAAATTGREGRFQLSLPRGAVRLRVEAAGFLGDDIDVTIGDQVVSIEVLLLGKSQFKESVNVTAGTVPMATTPSVIEVSPLEVRSVAGAAENVFKVLQTLPGVNATQDFGSRLSVRGGGPDQNLTVMDGVEIHDPYRLFGLTSAFNPETVENFELTTGGFSAKYGDRLSSILLIENRAGTSSKAFAGSSSLSLTDANVILEGKLPGGAKGSWLVTGRRTYYDLVANRIVGTKLPTFGDLQAKGVWEIRPGQSLTLFALRSRETTDAQLTNATKGNSFALSNGARNDMVSLSFASTIGAHASSRTVVSWYIYRDELGASGSFQEDSARSNAPGDAAFGRANLAFTRNLGVRDASLRQEFALRLGSSHTVESGFEAHGLRTKWGYTITGDRNSDEANGSSVRGGAGLPAVLDSGNGQYRAGAWVLDRFQVTPRILFEPGVRLDVVGLTRETIVSPRVAASIDLGGGYRVRGAAGLYAQSPGYEKMLQSDYFVDLSSARALGLQSERSMHLLGTLERTIAPGLVVRVEGYFKSFSRLIIGRLETPAETSARVALYSFPPDVASSVPARPQITSLPTNGATGRAYGFDVYLAHQATSASERLSGWVSYTWGRADRNAYGLESAFDYDRRHAVSLVGTYRVSRLIDVAGTVRAASGFPYTPIVGLRVASTPIPGANGSVVGYVPRRDANGLYVWTIDPGGIDNLNTGRLPMFARVDARVTFRPSWGHNRWQIYVEVINLLNRKNVSRYNPVLEYDPASDRPRLTYSSPESLPRLPTLGVRVRF